MRLIHSYCETHIGVQSLLIDIVQVLISLVIGIFVLLHLIFGLGLFLCRFLISFSCLFSSLETQQRENHRTDLNTAFHFHLRTIGSTNLTLSVFMKSSTEGSCKSGLYFPEG